MSKWRDISTAPKDRPVIVRTERGRVFRAMWTYVCEEAVGWGAVEEDDPRPKCWTDGFCWRVNEDEEESDKPTHWVDLPPPPEKEKT